MALRFVFLLLLVLVLLRRQDAVKVFMMFELDRGLQGKLFISHASEGDREVVWFLHCIVFGEDRLVVELSVHFRLLIKIEEEATLVP